MSGTTLDAKKLVIPIKDLPTLPGTAAEVLRLAAGADASADDLEKAISHDLAITAGILKVANSSVYSFKRVMDNVQDAVVSLGMRKVKEVATAVSMAGMFEGSHGLVEGPAIWGHALASALYAQEVSRLSRTPDPGYLFTAGLMHDIGIVILSMFGGDDYERVLRVARKTGFPRHEVEDRFLSTNHARVGGALCARWNLPPGLTRLICNHNGELTEPQDHVIRVAEVLAQQAGFCNFTWEEPEELPTDSIDTLRLSAEDCEILEQAADRICEEVSVFAS